MLKPLAVSTAIGLAALAVPAYSTPFQVTVTIAYDPSAIMS